MPDRFRGAAALSAAAALTLTAGCGLLGDDDEEPASEEEQLVQLLNESARLDAELTAAENRIIRSCLEEAGHTVHDEFELMEWAPQERDSLSWGYPHEGFLPDAEEAGEYGFGIWAEAPDQWESEEAQDYYDQQEEEYEEEAFEEPDNSEFEALDKDEKWDWYVAYVGEEKAEEWYGYVLDDGGGHGLDDGTVIEGLGSGDEEVVEDTEDGDLEFEGDAEDFEEPMPGGCQLEMIEGLYGEPELVEHEWEEGGESGTWTEWSYRPENPEYSAEETMWEDIEFEYQDRMIDLRYEFTDCLAEAGHAGWEFDEGGYLPTWEYFYSIYWEGEEEEYSYGGDSETELPDVPDDLGDDFEDQKAYEIDVALVFAECDEEVGYAEASAEAYDEVNISAYKEIEERIYSWQEDMDEAIEAAQEMIDA
ncbi:hypothetical protein [Glycomyces salinus]|uniref:hypothetical protein n=1 Tax=Glycomyces salinus TaxID=980294 RepID=UPI0018EE163A|nr:hypothetical protein [Glycomyces salinus]